MTLFDPPAADGDRPAGASGPAKVVVHFDGGSRGNPGPAAIGVVVTDPSVDPPARLATVSQHIGSTTNNVAEYRALIAGLDVARSLGARMVDVRGDSNLVIQQVAGRWKVKQPHLRPLVDEARALLDGFERVTLTHVPREENRDADLLVNAALDAC